MNWRAAWPRRSKTASPTAQRLRTQFSCSYGSCFPLCVDPCPRSLVEMAAQDLNRFCWNDFEFVCCGVNRLVDSQRVRVLVLTISASYTATAAADDRRDTAFSHGFGI